MNGHLARGVRALGAAVLVAAVLPLSAGPVSADSATSRGANTSDARCDDSPGTGRGQGNGIDKGCPDPTEAPPPTSAPTVVDDPAPAPAAAPAASTSRGEDARADVAKDNGKPAAASSAAPAATAKSNGKPASKPNKADAPRADTQKADAPKAPATSQPSTKDNGQKPDSPNQGGHTPVNVCHATSSDSNPYVFLTVDDDSVKAEGHLEHYTDPNKFWKSDGHFRGGPVKAGDPKRDLIGDYRDSAGEFHEVAGVITSEAQCGTLTPPLPPTPVAPAGSLDTLCTATAVKATVGPRSTGTTPGSFQLVYGATSTTVASGSVVDVPADADIELRFIPTSGAAKALERETSPKACPTPPPPPTDELTKTSVPASGSVVTPGQTITYTVTVRNMGLVPISNEPVVDTLPQFVTVVPRSVSDNGQVGPGGRTITWLETLAPGAGETYTYRGLVVANVPIGTSLVNRVTFLLQERTTTHLVGDRSLKVRKAASAAVVQFGDPLTYTLTVRAVGALSQTGVVVRDGIPAGTTYVGGSAACDGAGPCMEKFSNNEVTWELGSMAPGATRMVSFRVLVQAPRTTIQEGIPGVTIRNVGLAFSTEVPVTPSNEVVTEVVAVGGVKNGPNGSDDGDTPEGDVEVLPNAGGSLPRTGAGIPIGALLALGGILLAAGLALLRSAGPQRRT